MAGSVVSNEEYKEVDLRRFAQIVIEKWEDNIVSKNLIHSGDLLRSFFSTIQGEADGKQIVIEFTFAYWLRMIDMGVGKGVPYDMVQTVREARKAYGTKTGNRRKPVPVFNRTFYAEYHRMAELMAKQYAGKAVHVIAKIITDPENE